MNIKLKEKATHVLVDTQATQFHNKSRGKMTKIKDDKNVQSWTKTINSEVKPISTLAKGVNNKIRDWSWRANFMALPLNDFEVVLRVEFL